MKFIKTLSFAAVFILIGGFSMVNDAKAYGECSEYGLMSTYNYLNKTCSCLSGYAFKKDLFGNPKCTSLNTICTDNLGVFASYDSLSDSCECWSGYVPYNGLCKSGDSVCRLKHGLYSSYKSYSNSCVCDDGYTFDDDNQCVKKQNNVYFYLKELDTSAKKAIIFGQDYRYYLITYNTGCYASSFNRYVGKNIVVNLGTDFDVDAWDGVVLQDDDETCDITRVERADSATTFIEEDSEPIVTTFSCAAGTVNLFNMCVSYDAGCAYSFGSNAAWSKAYNENGQYTCVCKTGYQWSLAGNSCEVIPQSSSIVALPSAPASSPSSVAIDQKLTNKLKGYILLQTQSHGEAWYVHPATGKRYYMQNGSVAYQMMRSFGLGVTETDYAKILNGDVVLKNKLKGKIILRAQARGEAYYIHPKDLTVYYLKDGDEAYRIMRLYSLGITDTDINKLESDVIPQK